MFRTVFGKLFGNKTSHEQYSLTNTMQLAVKRKCDEPAHDQTPTHRLKDDYGPTIHINQKYPAGTKLVLVDPDHDIASMDLYLFPDGRRGWLDQSVVEELTSATSPPIPKVKHVVMGPTPIKLTLDKPVPTDTTKVDSEQLDISKMYPTTMPVPLPLVHDPRAQEAIDFIAAGEAVDAETARLLAEKQAVGLVSYEKMSDIQLIAYVDHIFDTEHEAVFRVTRDKRVVIDPLDQNSAESFTRYQLLSYKRYSRWTWKYIIKNHPGLLELGYYQKNK